MLDKYSWNLPTSSKPEDVIYLFFFPDIVVPIMIFEPSIRSIIGERGWRTLGLNECSMLEEICERKLDTPYGNCSITDLMYFIKVPDDEDDDTLENSVKNTIYRINKKIKAVSGLRTVLIVKNPAKYAFRLICQEVRKIGASPQPFIYPYPKIR